MLRPAANEIAGQQPAQRFVVARIGKIPAGGCAPVACQRFFKPPQLLEGNAPVGVRLRIIGPQRDGAIVSRKRLRVSLRLCRAFARL